MNNLSLNYKTGMCRLYLTINTTTRYSSLQAKSRDGIRHQFLELIVIVAKQNSEGPMISSIANFAHWSIVLSVDSKQEYFQKAKTWNPETSAQYAIENFIFVKFCRRKIRPLKIILSNFQMKVDQACSLKITRRN